MRPSFAGSTIALVVAVASISSGIHGYPYGTDSLVGGVTAIAGILAYRSAKERRLGLKPDSVARRGVEVGLLTLTCLPPLLLAIVSGAAIQTNPISCLFVPLWCVIAYVWVRTRRPTKDTPTTLSIH